MPACFTYGRISCTNASMLSSGNASADSTFGRDRKNWFMRRPSKRPKGLFSEFDVQHRHDRSSVSGDDDRLVRGSVQNGAQSRLCIMRCDGRGHGMFGELKTTYAESSRSQDPAVLPLKRLSVFTVFDFKKAAALPWVASARGRNYPQRLPPAAFVLSSF